VDPRRILGVNLASGVAYLALVEAPDRAMLSERDAVKIAPSDSYADGTRLMDFSIRFVQMARDLAIHTVAVADTRMHGGWAYAAAFERISLETTIMLGLKHAGIEYRSVKQSVDVARRAGIDKPDSKKITSGLEDVVDRSNVKHWKERAPALMVALAAAKA
jgi:hypothetical protein